MNRPPAVLAMLMLLGTTAAMAVDRSNDVQKLSEFLATDRSFSDAALKQAHSDLAQLVGRANQLSDPAFFLEVARLAAMADNGHSNLSLGPVKSKFGLLPVRVHWFSDSARIVRVRADYKRLLGARIVHIDGLDLAQAEQRMKVYHGGTGENFRAYYAPLYLFSPALLHAEGIARHPQKVTLGLVLANGAKEEIELTMDPNTARHGSASSWRNLSSLMPDAGGDAWVTIFDTGVKMPLYLEEPEQDYRYKLLENGVAYLQLRNNYASDGLSIKKYVKKLRGTIKADAPGNLVLDLRFNPGGDLTRTADFMLDLPAMLPPGGKVYVITGKATFSAAIYSSFFPKSAAPERTIIVGQRVGDRTRFWAETGKPLVLPDSGYRINYSLQMHDIGAGCSDRKICHLARSKRWNIAVGELEPDELVATTFADFMARRDPPLERALTMVGSISQSSAGRHLD
jgi:hypothetical protein